MCIRLHIYTLKYSPNASMVLQIFQDLIKVFKMFMVKEKAISKIKMSWLFLVGDGGTNQTRSDSDHSALLRY